MMSIVNLTSPIIPVHTFFQSGIDLIGNALFKMEMSHRFGMTYLP